MSNKRKAEDDPLIDSAEEKDDKEGENEGADVPAEDDAADAAGSDLGDTVGGGSNGNASDSSSDSDSDGSVDCSQAQAFVLEWLEEKRVAGEMPLSVLDNLGIHMELPAELQVEQAWGVVARLLTSPQFASHLFRAFSADAYRHKLPNINTFEDAVELLRNSSRIVILTGAGVSVSCGIPDFRSPGGLYEQIEEKYSLPDPQCLFDIHYLRDDPAPFFEFAREIYPGNHTPSATHYFIQELDNRGKLLRNYTQNIDTLEMVAGIKPEKLVNCHGSFATAGCIICKTKVDAAAIRDEILSGGIPKCKLCNSNEAFMKPDIVFFGEQLPDRFGDCFKQDRESMDLLIVMGSSLKVRPVAMIPEIAKKEIPQLLVNRELVAEPHEFDYAYLGDCDNFVIEICKRLGWTLNNKPPEEYLPINKPVVAVVSVSEVTLTTTVTKQEAADEASTAINNNGAGEESEVSNTVL